MDISILSLSLSFIFFSSPFHAGHVRSPSPRPGPRRCDDDDSLSAFSFLSFFFCSFFPLLKHKKRALLPTNLGISLLLLTIYLRHSLGIPLSSCHPRQGGAWGRAGAVWSGYGECSSESNEFESSELSIPSYETLKYSSYLNTNSHIFGSIHKCKVCIKPRI